MTPVAPTLRAAAAQIDCALGDLERNLATHERVLREAAGAGVELLLFPELSLTGYSLGPRVLEVALPADAPELAALSALAPQVTVAVGFVEQASPGELYNSVALLRGGRVLQVHRKLNLPTYGGLEEGKWFGRGRAVEPCRIQGGWSCATLICADLWNPALVHAAALGRPEILLAPIHSAEGAVSEEFSNPEGWALALAFYAMIYATPVVMANRCGQEAGRRFWGGSRILDPRGRPLAQAGEGEALIWADLDRAAIARARFELPTVRDADTPLVLDLLARRR
ncbi:MAG: carbon-nitrogen hydrolase [Deferrisomatales bacterium]